MYRRVGVVAAEEASIVKRREPSNQAMQLTAVSFAISVEMASMFPLRATRSLTAAADLVSR